MSSFLQTHRETDHFFLASGFQTKKGCETRGGIDTGERMNRGRGMKDRVSNSPFPPVYFVLLDLTKWYMLGVYFSDSFTFSIIIVLV